MRASDVERWEAMARQPRPPRRRWRSSIVAAITSALLVVATLALAEDAPPEATAQPTATETPSPEPSVAPDSGSGSGSSTEPLPSDEPPPGPSPSTEPSAAPEPSPTAEPVAAPTITSDKDDYPPGGEVILTGTNWQPGEQVHIRVNDDAGETWRRDVDVVSDEDGAIRDVFNLPDWFVAVYTVTATGSLSGIAKTTFTDATIMLSPTSGAVGTTVSVTSGAGSGGAFAANAAVTIKFDSTTIRTCTTNNGGNIPAGSCTFSVPSAAAGAHTVSGTDPNGKTASAIFTIIASNDAPTAVDDSATTDEDTPVTIDVLANDSDVDGDTFVLDSFTQPSHGTVTRDENGTPADQSDDELLYSPALNYNGPDSFTYTISDGALTDTAQVSITVNAVNDAPTAVDDTIAATEDFSVDTPVTSLLANDSDVDGDALVVTGTSDASGGAALLLTNGTSTPSDDFIRFTPNPNLCGPDAGSYRYGISDGNGGSDIGEVTVNIACVNDAPDITSAAFASPAAGCPGTTGATNATLVVSFDDVDDANPAFTAIADWDNDGTFEEGPFAATEPSFSRDHSYATAGIHTARVSVSDGSLSDSATATITVNYNTSGILQPVNWTQAHNDPSVFKHGSTIPVKVQFFNCDGTNAGGLSVKIEVKKLSGSTPPSGDNEVITNTNSPDSGGFMRWSSPLYIYNLNTKSLSDATATYEITLTVVSTGQKVFTQFGTRAK